MQSIKLTSLQLFFVLFILFAAIQLYFYKNMGVQMGVDSALYIEDAEKILRGIFPTERSKWYLSYSTFLAVVFYFKGNLHTVVLVQILFSGIAAICLYQLVVKICQERRVGFIAVFLYLGWFKIHEWNTFIYTESLFTSFCILSFTLLVKSKKSWQYVISSILLIFTFFIRPTGFSFLIGLVCYAISIFPKKTLKKSLWVPLIIILLIAVGILLNVMLKDYPLLASYTEGELIYPHITLGLQPPQQLDLPPAHYSPLVKFIAFVGLNPLYFLKLSLLKFLLFVGNVKPYFSWMHNFLIVLFLYPTYFFALKGYFNFPVSSKEKFFIAGYIMAQILTVTLTAENWDGRFLIPILPFIFILAAIGIIATLKRS